MYVRHVRQLMVALLLGYLALVPQHAAAHGSAIEGPRTTFTQQIGDRDYAVVVEPPLALPGPMYVDVVPLAPVANLSVQVRATPAGRTPGETWQRTTETTTAYGTIHVARVLVDTPGRIEVEVLLTGSNAGRVVLPVTVAQAQVAPYTWPLTGALSVLVVTLIIGTVAASYVEQHQRELPPALVRGLGLLATVAATVAATFGALQIWGPPIAQPAPVVGGAHINTQLDLAPTLPQVGVPLTLTMTLSDGGTGQPVDDLSAHHEALLHVFVVPDAGNQLQHVHPARTAPGRFAISVTPARAGSHTVYVEVQRGDTKQLLTRTFTVAGDAAPAAPLPAPGVQQYGDFAVDVQVEPAIAVGAQTTLGFQFTRGTAAVADLQPYLGMFGHLVVMSDDGAVIGHVHAAGPMTMLDPYLAEPRGGPLVQFAYTFPRAGSYRLWGQFRRNDVVITVPFAVNVTDERMQTP